MNEFGVRPGEAFSKAITTFFRRAPGLLFAGAVTFAVYAPFRWRSQVFFDNDQAFSFLVIETLGLIAAGTVAVPWYRHALAAIRDEPLGVLEPYTDGKSMWTAQAVCSFWFWAGVLIGFRLLFGIPSILVFLLYSFHGYIVADRKAEGGLMALGTSVRMTEGKRIGLFAIGGLLVMFNLFGAIALGAGINALTILGAAVGILITASITLLVGAFIYDAFIENISLQPPPPRGRSRA